MKWASAPVVRLPKADLCLSSPSAHLHPTGCQAALLRGSHSRGVEAGPRPAAPEELGLPDMHVSVSCAAESRGEQAHGTQSKSVNPQAPQTTMCLKPPSFGVMRYRTIDNQLSPIFTTT